MNPHPVDRPLVWSDAILDLQDALLDYDEEIYIVGGPVRDAFLRHPIHDIDLVTTENAIKLAKTIANSFNGDIFIMDAERGVARALYEYNGEQITVDVSKFRGQDLYHDLLDRDFTINAVAVDLRGDLDQVIDPLNGIDDLKIRLLRRCSPTSIADDPIRGLRAVRQSVKFHTRIEPQTLLDIRQNAPKITETSFERVRDEFFKCLKVDRPATALRVARSIGLLQVIFPVMQTSPNESLWNITLSRIESLNQIIQTFSPTRTDNTVNRFTSGMIVVGLDKFRPKILEHLNTSYPENRNLFQALLFACLVPTVTDADYPLDDILQQLRLSNAEKTHIIGTLEALNSTIYHQTPDDISVLDGHRFWFKYREAGISACIMAMADYLSQLQKQFDQDHWLVMIETIEKLCDWYFNHYNSVVDPKLLVNGNVLMDELQIPRGPKIGEYLTVIREAQVQGTITTKAEALQLIRDHM